jgi:tRNA (guanine37-N1)-methyltransferase
VRFDVITLFPELFPLHFAHGVTRRAFESGQVEVKLWQLRDFGDPPHARVDDRPYGGGPGMVLLVEPLLRALAAVRADRGDAEPVPVVNFSPAGRPLRQAEVGEFASGRGRSCSAPATRASTSVSSTPRSTSSSASATMSVRREIPALALLDAVARLQPGVLGDARSHEQDSFSAGLLDCPHYSRPEVLAEGGDGRGGAAGAALRQPRGDRALAPRPGPGADRRAPPRSRRRGRGRRQAQPGRPRHPRASQGGKAIIPGFPILCHVEALEPPHTSKACARSSRSPLWT